MEEKYPVINCHTHIFTGDHVPPYLAKTYVPLPLHYFLPLKPFVALFRWWYKGPATSRFMPWHKRMVKARTWVNAIITRCYPFNIIAGYYLFFFALSLVYNLLAPVFPPENNPVSSIINKLVTFLSPIFPPIESVWLKILIIVIVFIFFGSIRNMLLFFANLLWKFLSKLPGKQTREMFRRYLNIGRYAFHREQKTILSKLKAQYPKGTRFIILPMDMDYMGAGKSNTRYRDQMAELAEVKNMPSNKDVIYPFVFADPRRMVKVKEEKRSKTSDKEYFKWQFKDGKIKLEDCFIRDYLEKYRFSGIKIYPALGYYPFDETLLPLWKYAADNNIPVLTHCIRGVIFYRGNKEQSWNEHPVFQQSMRDPNDKNNDGFKDDEQLESGGEHPDYIPLVLPQQKNVDFSYNFTHPMNYLCLLEEELLRGIVGKAIKKNPKSPLRELFGYADNTTPLERHLKDLKICLGHFGGEDEWKRYFEKDRYNFSSQLIQDPEFGIDFFKTVKGDPSPGKPEQLWKFTDWYSIICSMILRYPKVYADISYILHGDSDILPLLKQTLQNKKLKQKILYGTDFFVVRNHKSDKQMLADMMGGLDIADFDQIARKNPVEYLKNSVPILVT